MTITRNKVLFLIFYISGFCSLLYQVVWIRLAFASFGVITPVLSIVISVFMLGLALGSWIGGKYIGKLAEKTNVSAIIYYGIIELFIGLGAFIIPILFSFGETILLPMGEINSISYLSYSAIILALSILPWCFCMGLTFPFMLAFIKEVERSNRTSFSFLYLANVIGAVSGTIISAIVLIELFGFSNTLLIAGCFNFAIALISVVLGIKHPYSKKISADLEKADEKAFAHDYKLSSFRVKLICTILFITGFSSMALEVIWTRAFTPAMGTQVYAFAGLLACYLLALSVGSTIYRRHLKKSKSISIAKVVGVLAITAFIPILVNDIRLSPNRISLLLSIIPFCGMLGYLTPMLIDLYSSGKPKAVGRAYAINIIGCILGPLFASYILLPTLGVRQSMILLAVPFLLIFVLHLNLLQRTWRFSLVVSTICVALCLVTFFVNQSYEEKMLRADPRHELRRDHTATVLSVGSDRSKVLLVNGIGVAFITNVTKFQAHLPLAFLNHEPRNSLVICFGVGATFRSALSWGINVTAIELVPSVKDAFPYFFEDAEEVMKNPKGQIVIDDGRRFLRRTSEKFDVITIDPPPPISAAGTSLLYSREFNKLLKAHLTDGGMIQQWFPTSEASWELKAVLTSLALEFPYIRVFESIEGFGHHFIASMEPFSVPTPSEFIAKLPEKAKLDIFEYPENRNLEETYLRIINTEKSPEKIIKKGRSYRITDDRPFNEYYILRKIAIKLNDKWRSLKRGGSNK